MWDCIHIFVYIERFANRGNILPDAYTKMQFDYLFIIFWLSSSNAQNHAQWLLTHTLAPCCALRLGCCNVWDGHWKRAIGWFIPGHVGALDLTLWLCAALRLSCFVLALGPLPSVGHHYFPNRCFNQLVSWFRRLASCLLVDSCCMAAGDLAAQEASHPTAAGDQVAE